MQAMPRASMCVQQSARVSVRACMHAGQSQVEGTDKSEAMSTISTSDHGEAMSTISTSDHGEHIHARPVHRAKCGHQNTRTPARTCCNRTAQRCLCTSYIAYGVTFWTPSPFLAYTTLTTLCWPHHTVLSGRALGPRSRLDTCQVLSSCQRYHAEGMDGVTLHEASGWLARV